MSALDPDDAEIVGRRKSPREVLRESLVTGAAIILPLAVTLLVLSFVVNFLSNALSPISSTAVGSLPVQNELIIQAVTVLVLVVVMFVVGFLALVIEVVDACFDVVADAIVDFVCRCLGKEICCFFVASSNSTVQLVLLARQLFPRLLERCFLFGEFVLKRL